MNEDCKFEVGDTVQYKHYKNLLETVHEINDIGHIKGWDIRNKILSFSFADPIDYKLIKKGEKQMKKSDLRTGMIVELINGDRGRVLLETKNGDIISGKDVWFPISSEYEEDLIPVRKHNN